MTLDDIRMFLAIARTGSLTAAAQSLYVSQPALSKRLARFEQELGATLTEPVNAADLPRERELVVHWGAGFLRWRQQRLNIARHPNVTLSVIGMALPFLRQGGWIIAPQTIGDAAASVMEELRCLPLLDPPPERTVYFAEEYGRHHEATDLLLELIHAKLRNRPGIRWLLG